LETHYYRLKTGQHRGEKITTVSRQYLFSMVQGKHKEAEYAVAELERRGTKKLSIDISGHAVDSASLYCLKHWKRLSNDNEGIHSWVGRMAEEALLYAAQRDFDIHKNKFTYKGLVFVYDTKDAFPMLLSLHTPKGK